jgi:N-acetylneuraminic acid mutarotase
MSVKTIACSLLLIALVALQVGCSVTSSPTSNPNNANVSSGSNSWSTDTAKGDPPFRVGMCVVAVGHKLYYIGGENSFGAVENIPIFNADSDKWEAHQDYWWEPHVFFSATVVNDKVYLIGGGDTAVQVYDPATGVAAHIPSTGPSNGYVRRERHVAAAVDGKIYLLGGIGVASDSNGPPNVDFMQVFNVGASQWSVLPNPINGVGIHPSACSIGGKIYLFGGGKRVYDPVNLSYDSLQGLSTLQVYDPATNTWTTPVTTGSPSPRMGHTASVVNGKMYVIGGYSSSDKYTWFLDRVDVFDPATNLWTTLKTTGTFTVRSGLGSGAINGKIYVLGGSNAVHIDDLDRAYFEVFTP